MTQPPPATGGSWNTGGQSGDDPSLLGSKRAKLRSALSRANEMRQSVVQQVSQQYAANFSQPENGREEMLDGMPGAFPDAAVVTSGNEQMILFPSYARRHVKENKARNQSATMQAANGQGRDTESSSGAGESDFVKQQWDEYEDGDAIVDVDVRGWVFSPQKGQMTRRQRLFITLARQLSGLPAPSQSPQTGSPGTSRSASPHSTHQQRVEERAQQREEEMAYKRAEDIIRKGEAEADAAGRGEYSERPSAARADSSSNRTQEEDTASEATNLRKLAANNAAHSDEPGPLQRRATWNHPADMSPEELASANAHLMARLAPFMSNPMADKAISAFFFNETNSRSRTIYTNASGHFALRASLDFVPTHVRLLASERLSATEEVIITSPKGVTLISDIDDTIKHSAISNGAREIFRNAFIRELGDLSVDGVPDWYNRLARLGVKFHYVSNSPWQLYPVITKYFEMTNLPLGSFHLKQYNGMLQGIFEPVAERKKGTLDRIARDFPERRFILVGDSGEADLEVYLDFLSENPGRVLAILIRDVTTPVGGGFFDSSMGPLAGDRSNVSGSRRGYATKSRSPHTDVDDPDLKAAIAASIKSFEEEEKNSRPTLPQRPSAMRTVSDDLIDLSENPPAQSRSSMPMARSTSDAIVAGSSSRHSSVSGTGGRKPPPTVPRKPVTLRSSSISGNGADESPEKKAPLPPPSRRSDTLNSNAPSADPPQSQAQKPTFDRTKSTASVSSTNSYASAARDKVAAAYNRLPAAPWNSSYVHTDLSRDFSSSARSPTNVGEDADKPPPPPPRRGLTSSTISAAAGAASRVGSTVTWNNSAETDAASFDQPLSRTGNKSTTQNGPVGGGSNQPINKRLELWQQRWERAQHYCRDRGVMLRSWRVGGDVSDETARLVERVKREEGIED